MATIVEETNSLNYSSASVVLLSCITLTLFVILNIVLVFKEKLNVGNDCRGFARRNVHIMQISYFFFTGVTLVMLAFILFEIYQPHNSWEATTERNLAFGIFAVVREARKPGEERSVAKDSSLRSSRSYS